MNPALLALIEQEAPNVIGYFKMMFHKSNPNDPQPTDAEVEAAYHQVLTDSLQKDEAWKAAHPQ